MDRSDLLLMDLYRTPRDGEALALAARHAPVLYFDANEPFLPLAAGYTLFRQDGPSPSMERRIELRPEDKPPASTAVEYAIWWDWDIHHLYELEHVWVYLDEQEKPVRVEGSWHGKFYEHPLQIENGHAVLLSEPGKHAFAPHPSWFQERASRYRRLDTQSVGAHAGVLVKEMFNGQIRPRVFDHTLARSFLSMAAFTPSGSFSKPFTFNQEMLVPWDALFAWIPRRVKAVLEQLQATLEPAQYRALRLISSDGSLDGVSAAAAAGADAGVLPPVSFAGGSAASGAPDLEEIFQFCRGEPMGVVIEPVDDAAVDRLAWMARTEPDLAHYLIVTSSSTDLLARYNSFIPGGITILQMANAGSDPLQAAKESGALFICPVREQLTPGWVERVHSAGLGVVSWPAASAKDAAALQRLGLDAVWIESPFKEDEKPL